MQSPSFNQPRSRARRPASSTLAGTRPCSLRLAFFAGALLGSSLPGCGDGDSPPEPIELLDPQGAPFGKTYDEWAAEWIRYVYSFSPPLCADPLTDSTGAGCNMGQDPASPVFFLVGTTGGRRVRTECVVPSGKALFFPLANIWADSAGLPPEDVLSPEDNKRYVEEGGKSIVLSSLYARVDGHPVQDVASTFTPEAVPYTIDFPPPPNAYDCFGAEPVMGVHHGDVQGAWVMIAPLPPGKHVIEFGSKMDNGSPTTPDFETDTRYELTVE